MHKVLFVAAKQGQVEYDEVTDEHLLETLKRAYTQHGYTVLTVPEGEDNANSNTAMLMAQRGSRHTDN